jgi:hypothetical protein
MNNSKLDLITHESLLAWQRVRVASAVASTGEEWWQTFKTSASGTVRAAQGRLSALGVFL